MITVKRLIIVNPDGTIETEKEVKEIRTNPDGSTSFELEAEPPAKTE